MIMKTIYDIASHKTAFHTEGVRTGFLRWSILALLFFAPLSLSAQRFTPASADKQKECLNRIVATSSQMSTMECRFEQTQKSKALMGEEKSEGYMQYRKPDCMRWQYEKPTDYSFVVNRGKAVMKKGGKSVRNGAVRVFAHISKMVLSSISGKNVVDEKNFVNTYETSARYFRITMVPRRSDMRRVIASIVMTFDMQNDFIHEIVMNGKNSTTTILFSNKKANVRIADSQFKI
jgi:hypothetical protein